MQKGDVHLIVADSILRGGNGEDLAKAATRQGIPVILMSGEPERIGALSGGPLPFLAKPFHAATLVRMVARLLP